MNPKQKKRKENYSKANHNQIIKKSDKGKNLKSHGGGGRQNK